MSRGGRRRKGKRGRRGPATPAERKQGSGQEPVEPREGQPTARRRTHGRAPAREVSVLDSMRSLPSSLKTLPPDGTDLDDLIGALQSEYGVPTPPQEYRLIIKVPASEEPPAPHIEARPVTATRPDKPDPEPQADGAPARQRPARRRRRGRRRGGGTAVTDG
ncbi:MAG: hypothetical protein WD178_00605, partial [Actinomycetota bacterium]